MLRDAAGLRSGGEPLEIGRIPADHGMAAWHDAGEDLRLGIGNAVERVEVAEVARGDGRDDRHMGLDHADERRDLARVVHADLEHAEGRLARHAGERQRHAPVIVEGGGGGMRLAGGRKRHAQHLLGRGLAHAAGDRHDLPMRARTRRAAHVLETPQRILRHLEHRPCSRHLRRHARDDAKPCTGLQRIGHEVMPVMPVALDGDEDIALRPRGSRSTPHERLCDLAVEPASRGRQQFLNRPQGLSHDSRVPSAAFTAS
jgi:hypothetical protein